MMMTITIMKSLCLINQALFNEGIYWSGSIAPPFLTSALEGGEWSASRPGRFTPREIVTSAHWIWGWWAPEPVWTLWRREESYPCRESNPGRPAIARRYTE
jgi:hypothetical protein